MRILIAEDSLTQAVDLRRRLEQAGHTVIVTADGLKAWKHLQARPEPLVISDWMMPELNGVDLCRKLRAELTSPYIYFILLTAKSHRHERLQGLDAGADDFLTKPIDSIELDIALRTAQRIISAQETLRSRASELERTNQELSLHSTVDPLTGLRSSRAFREALDSACLHATAMQRHLSVIRLEMGGFSWQSPRELAIAAAQILRGVQREGEIACHHGEEGFALILPGEDLPQARARASALHCAIISGLTSLPGVSLGIGVATWSPGAQLADPGSLLDACEADLVACPH